MFTGVRIHVIKPAGIQPSLTTHLQNHFVYSPKNPIGKLMVFLGGTSSKPANYQSFPAFTCQAGYHVINLSYPNDKSSLVCGMEEDLDCFSHFRQAVLLGNSPLSLVPISEQDCILSRVKALILHLQETFPAEGWGAYYDGQTLNSPLFTLAGHSQGAGHCVYWAQRDEVDKVILFAGPNDYSEWHKQAAPWLTEQSKTPLDRYVGTLHTQDEVIHYAQQHSVWTAMGLIGKEEHAPIWPENGAADIPRYNLTLPPHPDQMGIAPYHSMMVADTRSSRTAASPPPLADLWDEFLNY